MSRNLILLLGLLIILGAIVTFRNSTQFLQKQVPGKTDTGSNLENAFNAPLDTDNPLSIASLRAGDYPGSDPVIEETLAPGSKYSRYIVSYQSEGNKIYALLTIPSGEIPEEGFPVIIFNHGYIPPAQYRTTERYIAYTDGFSRNGYVLLRPDYRGHGNSEGEAVGGYGSNAYTIDVLNAVASVKRLGHTVPEDLTLGPSPERRGKENVGIVDPNKIGMWGHSMGGHITLRNMVVNKDVKAGVIWAGVVASYPDLINNWRRGITGTPPPLRSGARRWRQVLTEEFGEPSDESPFWRSISANAFLSDISGPVQLHHSTADHSVPPEFSRKLVQQLKDAGKEVEYYEYPGDDHDITANFGTAMQRSIEFFDKYVKNAKS